MTIPRQWTSAEGIRCAARPVFEYDLDNPLRIDNCETCGALNWRECVCDPSAPRPKPTLEQIERSRDARLSRAERGEHG